MMVGEAKVGMLNFNHKVYVSDKYDLATVRSLSDIPLKYKPMRNHHDILMTSGKDSQESRLSSPDGDNDVPEILYNMLTKCIRRMIIFMKILRELKPWIMMV